MSKELSENGLEAPKPSGSEGFDGARQPGIWTRYHLGAVLAHLALSVIFTWPLVLNFLPGSTDMVPGALIVDRDQNLWNLWWVGHALSGGHNPFISDFIWYPTPVTLYFHTLNVFNGLLAFPLLGILPLTVIYNLVVLFSFVVGGYGAFLLVHYLCGNRWAALVGSVVFAYSAYHIATLRGLLQLISLEWVPFFVLFLLKAVLAPGWESRRDFAKWGLKLALPTSIALLLVSLVDWYYTMYALMLAGLLGIYLVVRHVWERKFRVEEGEGGVVQYAKSWRVLVEPLGRIAICVGIYSVLVSPILVPTLGELRSADYVLPGPDAALSNSADLLTFFQPPRDNRILGRLFTNRQDWPFASNRYEVYFTYAALILGSISLFGTKRIRPRLEEDGETAQTKGLGERLPGKWFWAACTLLFFLLALGPVLQINGQQFGWVPMPYRLIEHLPILNISRSPDRFDMPLTLCLGVLAGYGTNVLAGSRRGSEFLRRGPVLALGATALIMFELAPMPYVQRSAQVPRWYEQLGAEAGDFSILELPAGDDYWHGAFRMFDQTAHGKRIFWGYLSREYPHPFVSNTPGYEELTSPGSAGDMFDVGPNEWLSALAFYNTHYVVLQKVRLPELQEEPVDVSPSRDAIASVLGADQPVYEDEQLAAYRVPLPAATVPFLSLDQGWEPHESGPNGTFRWMHESATLRIDSPRRMDAYLSFRATALGDARALQVFHGDTLVFDGPVGPLESFKIGPLGLPQGTSMIRLVSPTGTTSPAALGQGNDKRQLSFAFLNVKLMQP